MQRKMTCMLTDIKKKIVLAYQIFKDCVVGKVDNMFNVLPNHLVCLAMFHHSHPTCMYKERHSYNVEPESLGSTLYVYLTTMLTKASINTCSYLSMKSSSSLQLAIY